MSNVIDKVIHRVYEFAMEMGINWFGTAILAGFLCSLVASVTLMLFGGYGGFLLLKRDVQGLRYDLEIQEEKLTREVKQRAGFKGVLAKKNLSEVDRILEAIESNKENGANSSPTLEGRRAAILKKAGGV